MKASLLGRVQRRLEEKCTMFRSQASTNEPQVQRTEIAEDYGA
jgi:hypothetical protein